MRQFLLLLLLAAGLAGCATNPVTGKTELTLVSESQEVAIGKQNYGPTLQTQGGTYTIDPELSAYVAEVGKRLAAVSDRPQLPYEFVVVNDSTPNAWALPGGKIAVNRGLLVELKSEAELAAVLGHEIVHAAARHGAQSMERGMLLQSGVALVGVAAQDSRLSDLLVGGAGVGATLIASKYGRDAELESDHYGMLYMSRAGYEPRAAVDLMETFVRLSQGRDANWLEGLFASHPPSEERVAANRANADKLPRGRTGEAEYRARVAHLIKTRQAYAHLDAGRAALKKKAPDEALKLADKALAIEPKEALFHGLKAEAYRVRGDYPQSKQAYDQAIARNPDYFGFYLGRGLVRRELHDPAAAADFEHSNRLLPTATAHYALGQLALARGDPAAALRNFEAAAGSDSEPGRQSAAELTRLMLPREPERFIQVAAGVGQDNAVLVAVANRAPLAVQGITIQARLYDGQGRLLREQTLQVPQTLPPGGQVYLNTRLGPLADKREIGRVRLEVQAARVAD